MSRYVGYAYPDGLYILDSVTGQVTKVPSTGGDPEVIQPVQTDWTESYIAVEDSPVPAGATGVPLDDDMASIGPPSAAPPDQTQESFSMRPMVHPREPVPSRDHPAVPASAPQPVFDGAPPHATSEETTAPQPAVPDTEVRRSDFGLHQSDTNSYQTIPAPVEPETEPEPTPSKHSTLQGLARESWQASEEPESADPPSESDPNSFDEAWSGLSYDTSSGSSEPSEADEDSATDDEGDETTRTQQLPAARFTGDDEYDEPPPNPFDRSDQDITGRSMAPWSDPTSAPNLGVPPISKAEVAESVGSDSLPSIAEESTDTSDTSENEAVSGSTDEIESDAEEAAFTRQGTEQLTIDTQPGLPRMDDGAHADDFSRRVSDTQPGLPSQRQTYWRELTPPQVEQDLSLTDADIADDPDEIDLDFELTPSDSFEPQPSVESPESAEAVDATDRVASFDRELLNDFPYPIAVSYLAFITERDPQLRCRGLADSFVSVLRTWALMVLGQVILSDLTSDSELDDLLRRDAQRPTADTFNLLISKGLSALQSAEQTLFCPELADAYGALETACDDQVVLQVRYEEPVGRIRFKPVELGKIQALIRYSNSLIHGLPETPERAKAQLEVYTPLLKDVLAAARFMVAYPLFYMELESIATGEEVSVLDTADLMRDTGDESGRYAFRLAGAVPPSEPELLTIFGPDQRAPSLFFVSEATGDWLAMKTLAELETPTSDENAIHGIGRDLFLFDGYYGGGVLYTSASGQRIERFDRLGDWRAAIVGAANDVDVDFDFDFEAAGVPELEAIVEIAGDLSCESIAALVASGIYLRDATIERPAVNEKLLQLDLGDHRAIVLGGESGVGKTTLLAQLTEVRLERGDVVLFYEAADFGDGDIAGRISRDLGLGHLDSRALLDKLDACFSQATPETVDVLSPEGSSRLFVLIDGVTEFTGREGVAGLIRAIEELVSEADSHPWFRLVGSVRSSVYKGLQTDEQFGKLEGGRYLTVCESIGETMERTHLIEIPSLSPADVAVVYDRYRDYRQPPADAPESSGLYVFRPQTELGDLDPDGSTVAMLRKPLLMRLALSAFNGEELPSDLGYSELIDHYFDRVIEERAGDERPFRERITFLAHLVQELDTLSSPQVPRDHLYGVDGMRQTMLSSRPDSVYHQLIDLGVLREDWSRGDCRVRFSHHRVFEYLLSKQHRFETDDVLQVFDLARQALGFDRLRGALALALLDAAKEGRGELITQSFLTASSDGPDSSFGESEVIIQVIFDVLEHLAWVQPALFATLLPDVLIEPTGASVDFLVSLGRHLYEQGSGATADIAIDLAVSLAEQLTDAGRLASALVLRSQRRAANGLIDEALANLEAARLLALESGDAVRATLIEAERGRQLRTFNRNDEAFGSLTKAADKFIDLGSPGPAARARLELAEVLNDRGDLDAEIGATQDALEWAREADVIDLETHALGRLAWLYLRAYELEKSLTCQSQALNAAITQGDYRTIASMLNLKGLVSWDQNFEEAAAALVDSRNLALRTGDRRAVMVASSNLADLRLLQGHLEEAEILTRQSISMARELGASESEGWNLGKLAKVALEAGTLTQSQSLAEDALTRNEAIENRRGEAFALGYLAEVELERGQMDSSRELALRAITILEELGETSEIAWLWQLQGQTYLRVGRLDQAKAHFSRVAAVGEKAGIPFTLAIGLCGLAQVERLRGNWDDAHAKMEQAITGLTRVDTPAGISRAKQALCLLYLDQSEYEAATATCQECHDVAHTLANPRLWAQAHHAMALVFKEAGDVGEALRRARQSLEIRKILDHPLELAESWATLGVCYNLDGNLEQAAECFHESLQLADATGDAPHTATALWLSASLAIDRGSDEPVLDWAEQLNRLSRTVVFPIVKAINAALQVRLAARNGDEFKLHNALLDVEASYSAVPGTPALELSPTSAYLDSAVFYLSLGRTRRSRELANLSRETAGDRPYPRFTELQHLPKGDHTSDFESVPS